MDANTLRAEAHLRGMSGPSLIRWALTALRLVRPLVKLSAGQSAAWDTVVELLSGQV